MVESRLQKELTGEESSFIQLMGYHNINMKLGALCAFISATLMGLLISSQQFRRTKKVVACSCSRRCLPLSSRTTLLPLYFWKPIFLGLILLGCMNCRHVFKYRSFLIVTIFQQNLISFSCVYSHFAFQLIIALAAADTVNCFGIYLMGAHRQVVFLYLCCWLYFPYLYTNVLPLFLFCVRFRDHFSFLFCFSDPPPTIYLPT